MFKNLKFKLIILCLNVIILALLSLCFKRKNLSLTENISRDFYRYKCENRKRIGGKSEYIQRVPHELYRTEGAWFVCLDRGVAPIKNNCRVLSFGINDDESFDREINALFNCQIESFDPFIESRFFKEIRNKDVSVNQSVTLNVNEQWRFHRIGIVGETKSIRNENRIGWMAKFEHILAYTKLENKIIDILKMDIENGEWEFLMHADIIYLCKYVKQLYLETHTPGVGPLRINVPLKLALKLLRQLEQCFLLFHRDTRFYKDEIVGLYGFHKTEFQQPIVYKIDLEEFSDETEIIDFMVTYGEIYFINKNFLKVY